MTHIRIRPFNTRDTYPEQSLDNDMSHLVKLVVYMTDVRHRGAVYRVMGDYIRGVHPVCTGLVVVALARPEWLVEIGATAVIPD